MRAGGRRLPLTALRTFEAAARRESFEEAAAELLVSPTAVSSQIRALERDLGFPLFVRKTRQVVLTDAGLSLSRVVRNAFAAIAREIDFQSNDLRSSMSIAVGPIFSSRWLMPRLNRLRQAFPEIELSIYHGRRITGSNDMPAAIAIDWGFGDWPGLEAQLLFGVRLAPVISPALAKTHGDIATPGDLARVPVLYQRDRSEWNAWLGLVGAAGLRFAEETTTEDTNVVLQAAIAGQGVAIGTFPFIQDEIDAGRLIKPFAAELLPSRSYYVLTLPGARQRPEVAAICDWLLREAKEFRTLEPQTAAASGADTASPASVRATSYAQQPGRAEKARGRSSPAKRTATPSSMATPLGKSRAAMRAGKTGRRSASLE